MNRMRRVKPAGFVVVSIFWLGAASAVGQIMDDTHPAADQPVHVRAHAGELQKEAIPPTIFGSFLESDRPLHLWRIVTYGGLWSELPENGSFEEGLWSARSDRQDDRRTTGAGAGLETRGRKSSRHVRNGFVSCAVAPELSPRTAFVLWLPLDSKERGARNEDRAVSRRRLYPARSSASSASPNTSSRMIRSVASLRYASRAALISRYSGHSVLWMNVAGARTTTVV